MTEPQFFDAPQEETLPVGAVWRVSGEVTRPDGSRVQSRGSHVLMQPGHYVATGDDEEEVTAE